MSANVESDQRRRTPWTTALLLGGLALAIAAFQASAATASPNNCGELPGIARTATMVIGTGVAVGILILGGILAAVTRRPAAFGVAAAVAAGCVAGLVVGAAVTPPNPCGSDLPRETRQRATLVLTLGAPYTGARVEGPGECRRASAGANVREVVSDLAARSAWVIGGNPMSVNIEVYPGGGSPYPGADYLRVFLNRGGATGAFGIYADGDGVDIDVATVDGATGRVSFTSLPPWADNEPGTGLPVAISGAIQWTCTGPEE